MSSVVSTMLVSNCTGIAHFKRHAILSEVHTVLAPLEVMKGCHADTPHGQMDDAANGAEGNQREKSTLNG